MSSASGPQTLRESSEKADFDDESLKDLVAKAELVDVRTTKWHAELFRDAETPDINDIELKLLSSFRYTESGFDTKFHADIPLSTAGASDRFADIQIELVASFTIGDSTRPQPALVAAFMDQVGLFVVMPFIREGLRSLSTRIGLEPITLGLARDKSAPVTASVRRRNIEESNKSDDQEIVMESTPDDE